MHQSHFQSFEKPTNILEFPRDNCLFYQSEDTVHSYIFDLSVPSHLSLNQDYSSGAVTGEEDGKVSVESAQTGSNRKTGFCSKTQHTA